ncbi:MAG: hypothetical protein AAF830_16145 [Pseudomonadota bacterium]
MRGLANLFLFLGALTLAAVMSVNLYGVMLTDDPVATLASETWWTGGWPVSLAALALLAAGTTLALRPQVLAPKAQKAQTAAS